MENDFEEQLKKELQSQGALEEETRGLMESLNKISKFSKIERSQAFKNSFLESLSKPRTHNLTVEALGVSRGIVVRGKKEMKRKEIFFLTPRIYIPAMAFALLFIIIVTEVANAQKSLPGQPLYPIKRLSENIAKAINPSFKDEILRRRSEEIKNLTEQRKDSNLLKKTVNDYNGELKDTRTINKVKIEESKNNLEEARNNSDNGDEKEIEYVIIQTENKIRRSHRDWNEKKNEDVKGAESKVNPQNQGDEHHDENSLQQL